MVVVMVLENPTGIKKGYVRGGSQHMDDMDGKGT